jgi:hypothetical protein
MIVVYANTYERFKANFVSLGGSHRTPVLVQDNVATGGGFNPVAVFAEALTAVGYNPPEKPATFDADFPQATYVDQIAAFN